MIKIYFIREKKVGNFRWPENQKKLTKNCQYFKNNRLSEFNENSQIYFMLMSVGIQYRMASGECCLANISSKLKIEYAAAIINIILI